MPGAVGGRLVGGDTGVDLVGKSAVVAERGANLRLGQAEPLGRFDDGGLPAGVEGPDQRDVQPVKPEHRG